MKIKKRCEKHGDYESEQREVLGLCFDTPCPECAKVEQERLEQEEREEQEEQKRLLFQKMNIEPEYYGATLENYRPENESQKKALESCKRLVNGELKKVILLGSNGVGKTHLASAVVKALQGRIYTLYEIGLIIRGAYAKGQDEYEKLDTFARLPVLAIDEMGRTKNSDAERNYLSYIIDKRHTRGLPTLMISNFHLQRSCKNGKCDRCFENLIDSDIVSRFRQKSEIVEINGTDKRSLIYGF